ncbi:MAG: hypothetical protein ACHQRM_13845 [Bacteroidia bacterium]
MRKNLLFSCICLFTLHLLSTAGTVWHDTCYITSAQITPDIRNKEISGINIDVVSYLKYDKQHVGDKPSEFMVTISILTAGGKPLPALSPRSQFCRNGFAGAEKSEFGRPSGETTRMKFFIPYYVLNLPPGEASLQCSIQVSVLDTSIIQKPRHIPSAGPALQSFTIHKPAVIQARMLCTGVRVTAKDHGRNWDFGLTGLPDPVFKVILDNEAQPDFLYTSPEVQNSLSAAWLDFSPHFLISEGDKITLGIYDKDTLIDDLIGKETHTLDEWIEITKAAKELAFDQVLFCTVKVEKVK